MNKRIKRKRFKAITTCKRCTGRRLKTLLGWANQYAKSHPGKSHQVSKSSINHIDGVSRYVYTPFYNISTVNPNMLNPLFHKLVAPLPRPEHIKTISYSSIRHNNIGGSRYVFISGLRTALGFDEDFIIDLVNNKLLDILWYRHDSMKERNSVYLYYINIKGLKKMHLYAGKNHRITYLTNLEDEEIGDWTRNINTFLRHIFRENDIPESQELIEVLESELII